jgi:hypothetical protein
MLDSVMRPIAAQRRPLTFSRNSANAMTVVATISKLPSREALADVPMRTPSISRIGAMTSSAIIPTV